MAAGRLYVAEGLVRKGALAIGWNDERTKCFRVFISPGDYNIRQNRYYINDETIGDMRMFTDRLFKALGQRRSRGDIAVKVESVVFYCIADNPTATGPQVHVLVPESDLCEGPPYILDDIIPGMFYRGRALFSEAGSVVRSRRGGDNDQNDGNNRRSQTSNRMRLSDHQNDGNNNRSRAPARMRLPDTPETDMGQNRTTQRRCQTAPPARRSPGTPGGDPNARATSSSRMSPSRCMTSAWTKNQNS